MDGSALLAELGATPEELASAIRTDVRERTGCTASVGMGEWCHAFLYHPWVTFCRHNGRKHLQTGACTTA